jgi:cation diffusion facilitator CzcD-associated flavoprotein CzcO
MTEKFDSVVVGGGQAGLAVSHELTHAGVEHVVLPAGPVLVVGSGQSGCQIAEELLEAGREVFLSCGKAPWLPRRIGDRDLFWWAMETVFQDTPVGSLPAPTARLAGNVLATGRDGGHDLHLRVLRKQASPCSAASPAPTAAARSSRPTCTRAWPGATSARRSSWTSSASWSPSGGFPTPRCRRRSPGASRRAY